MVRHFPLPERAVSLHAALEAWSWRSATPLVRSTLGVRLRDREPSVHRPDDEAPAGAGTALALATGIQGSATGPKRVARMVMRHAYLALIALRSVQVIPPLPTPARATLRPHLRQNWNCRR